MCLLLSNAGLAGLVPSSEGRLREASRGARSAVAVGARVRQRAALQARFRRGAAVDRQALTSQGVLELASRPDWAATDRRP